MNRATHPLGVVETSSFQFLDRVHRNDGVEDVVALEQVLQQDTETGTQSTFYIQ